MHFLISASTIFRKIIKKAGHWVTRLFNEEDDRPNSESKWEIVTMRNSLVAYYIVPPALSTLVSTCFWAISPRENLILLLKAASISLKRYVQRVKMSRRIVGIHAGNLCNSKPTCSVTVLWRIRNLVSARRINPCSWNKQFKCGSLRGMISGLSRSWSDWA